MEGHTFFGKQQLCYTEVSDFTDYQGVGQDPLYRRFDSVFSIVKKAVPPDLWHFLATPEYQKESDQIRWHVDRWSEAPSRLCALSGEEYDRYKAVLDATVDAYRSACRSLKGEELQMLSGAIKYVDEERVYCHAGKVYLVAWGMTPDLRQHKVVGAVIHEIRYNKKYKVTFDAGAHGTIPAFGRSIGKVEGTVMDSADFPPVTASEGWAFVGWQPSPLGLVVSADMQFVAQYEEVCGVVPPAEVHAAPVEEAPYEEETPYEEEDRYDIEADPGPEERYYICRFDAGAEGVVKGVSELRKAAYSMISEEEVPEVKAHRGYRFKGWNVSPCGCVMDGDKVFYAQYDKKEPWYKRWWDKLVGLLKNKKPWRWLLWLLFGVLLLWLLPKLFRGCSCSSDHRPVNGVLPVDTVVRDDGRVEDDNGRARPVTGEDGALPDGSRVVAPITGDDGAAAPIVEQPGMPKIIANRLLLFMEDEDGDLDRLSQAFKKAFPDNDKYAVIGFDREAKYLVVKVPEEERVHIRKTINGKIPDQAFFVFDEVLYEMVGLTPSQSSKRGWHLDAIGLKEGWRITEGDPKVKVAVVDDGIEASHPMFRGRIVEPYNVFTQDNRLSSGVGHGTHVAGLAAGCAEYLHEGAAGVAPNCKVMPIQVFDNGQCPLSALIAGIMYAVHHDADVVNISIAPYCPSVKSLPPSAQKKIADTQLKDEERLFRRVCTLAAKKQCILVFAAGNDSILSIVCPENRNDVSLTVTAVDSRLCATDFTNYGSGSDISAPGEGIMSAFPGGGWKSLDGTSMAAPIVTGTVALMKSLKKDLTVEQAWNVLYKSGADVYGDIPPMVLVDKALQCVQRGDFSTPPERARRPLPADDGRTGDKTDGTPPPEQAAPAPPPDDTDYEAIRRLIEEHKKEIERLEKLLPKK